MDKLIRNCKTSEDFEKIKPLLDTVQITDKLVKTAFKYANINCIKYLVQKNFRIESLYYVCYREDNYELIKYLLSTRDYLYDLSVLKLLVRLLHNKNSFECLKLLTSYWIETDYLCLIKIICKNCTRKIDYQCFCYLASKIEITKDTHELLLSLLITNTKSKWSLSCMRKIINSDYINTQYSSTFLIDASKVDNYKVDIGRLLLDCGADVNLPCTSKDNATVLVCLVGRCKTALDIEFLKMLIDAGADVNSEDDLGYTPLTLAVLCSTDTSSIDCVHILINAGANINYVNNEKFSMNDLNSGFGWSPLIIAARYSTECTKILLDAGADVNLNGRCLATALFQATAYCGTTSSLESVQMLIDAGSNINVQNHQGFTPLIASCRHYNETSTIECIKLLIDSGANLELKNNNNHTALHIAVGNCNENSSIECVKMLLDAGADIDCLDNLGRSPLFVAISLCTTTSSIKAIEILLDAGANTNIQDSSGTTPLMEYIINVPSTHSTKELLEKLIIRSRLTLNCKDKYNKTAYDYYVINNCDILDEYFIKLLKGDISLANCKSARST